MKDIIISGVERMDEPELNRRIILLWLEKLEVMTPPERKTILKVIELLSNPMFITK